MRKILLASAGVMVMSAGVGYAACIPTPSCASLGYESSSSCEGGIKCPFGNAWNCTLVNKITELEKVIEEGGAGGNKNCAVGHIYYSDKTCSASLDSSKTPIGVVVYVDGQGHGQTRRQSKKDRLFPRCQQRDGNDIQHRVGGKSGRHRRSMCR